MEGESLLVDFVKDHFGSCQLGDRRREKRLRCLAEAIIRHPGGTLPDKISDPASLKALYRLMNQEAVTHEAILASSRETTLARMKQVDGTVLLVHDTTELNYTGLKSISTLGPLGCGTTRGYLAHNTLAVVAETREVLGLAYQKLAKRPTVIKKETRAQRRERPDRETRLWKEASQSIPAALARHLQVELADRGGDVLELLDYFQSQGKFYVVRSKHNRRIVLENKVPAKLHDFARALPAQGTKTIEIPAHPEPTGRAMNVSIAWGRVVICIPEQPRGEFRDVPLATWVLCIREIDAPPGSSPVEWILLTNVPITNLEDAQKRISWYECRWMIEEYHKVLKTGCGIETLQFTSEEALKPTIALLSISALFLLNLRYVSRQSNAQQRPATEVLPPLCVEVLSLWRYQERRTNITVHEFFQALARLGGHQNRKHDHPPGWLVLWRGWTKLQSMLEIATSVSQKRSGQT